MCMCQLDCFLMASFHPMMIVLFLSYSYAPWGDPPRFSTHQERVSLIYIGKLSCNNVLGNFNCYIDLNIHIYNLGWSGALATDLIKLLNFINLELPTNALSEPLHDVNDTATDKLFTSYVSMSNDNDNAPAIIVSSMILYSKISLHAFGSRSTSYSTIWRNNIKFVVSK